MDYEKLIDEETWAFIAETETYYPPDAVTLDIKGQRAVYDRMCRAFFQGYPDGVRAEDHDLGNIAVRVYSAGEDPAATVVYFHGGGFVVGYERGIPYEADQRRVLATYAPPPALVPLVKTRAMLVSRDGIAGIAFGYDGVPRLEGVGRTEED